MTESAHLKYFPRPDLCPSQNRLLAALPEDVRERVYPALEAAPLLPGKVLHEAAERVSSVYFPCDAIVSLIHVLADGSPTEAATVGNEGAIGAAVFLGGGSLTLRAVVRSGGYAFRMKEARFIEEFHRQGEFFALILRYTQVMMTHMAQMAACNRHHSIEQQVCRCLLSSLDRLSANEICMTQELMANLLGVRREGVTEAAGKLQKLGLIEYHRGHITVLDRARLEQLACECYDLLKRETERLLWSDPLTKSKSVGKVGHEKYELL